MEEQAINKQRVISTAWKRSGFFDLKKKRHPSEALIQAALYLCGLISILTTIGIIYELGKEAWLFFGDPNISLWGFLTGTVWKPSIGKFGVLPLVTSTTITSVIAMLVALPLGLLTAVF